MLDQMIESKDTLKESKTLLYLFSFLTILAVSTVIGVGIWHLSNLLGYYQKGGMSGDLELTSLVAPVPVQPDEPPPVEDTPKKETPKNLPNVDTRTEIIQRMDEVPRDIPDKTSTEKVNIPPRDPNKLTVKGDTNKSFDTSVPNNYRGDVNPNSQQENKCQGVGCGDSKNELDGDSDKEVVVVKTPTPRPIPKTISGGVVNGKARNLVTPQYPSAARAVRASGQVSVQVTIDESGNVISASATSGHTLLRSAAESAARASKFNPTLLSGQPVKVTGVIIYNFVAP
ncbi:hypothetical protein BH10ACI1_BH10ACI1_11850 [soil metagenome]